jgi:hypothetical protein
MSTVIVDDRDPPTEVMSILEGVTTAGAPAMLSLQHLHSLLTTLEPLRTAYTNAAVDRLRGLPAESRRALLPHVLHEHPELAGEPRIGAMARDLGIDVERAADRPDLVRWLARVSGVRVESAREALDRVERALDVLGKCVTELATSQRELAARVDPLSSHELPLDARDVMQQALAERDTLGDALTAMPLRASAATEAARDAAEAMLDAEDLPAFELEAAVPKWWPSPFREAALWSRVMARRKTRRAQRTRTFEEAFAHAYLVRLRAVP